MPFGESRRVPLLQVLKLGHSLNGKYRLADDEGFNMSAAVHENRTSLDSLVRTVLSGSTIRIVEVNLHYRVNFRGQSTTKRQK